MEYINLVNDANPMLALLIKHEEAIADLYASCSHAFPREKDFWLSLVIEEKAHVHVLFELEQYISARKVHLNTRKFNAAAVSTAIGYVNSQKQRVSTGQCSLIQTLVIALDIERAIIEKDFFEVFESDLAVIKHEFRELRNHTAEHAKRIATMIETEKQKSGHT